MVEPDVPNKLTNEEKLSYFVEELLKTYDITITNYSDWSSIAATMLGLTNYFTILEIKTFIVAFHAAEIDDFDVLNGLYLLGADLKKKSDDGSTLAHKAAKGGHVNTLRYLHYKLEFDLTEENNDGLYSCLRGT